jgi:hypothetical protein
VIRPSSWTTLTFLGLLAVVVCVGLVAANASRLVEAYYVGPGGKAIRRTLGFELSQVSIASPEGQNHDIWVFTNIHPSGPLGLAGLREGDAWVRIVEPRFALGRRPAVAAVYDFLSSTSAAPVNLEVINLNDLKERWWQGQWWSSVRVIAIPACSRQSPGA